MRSRRIATAQILVLLAGAQSVAPPVAAQAPQPRAAGHQQAHGRPAHGPPPAAAGTRDPYAFMDSQQSVVGEHDEHTRPSRLFLTPAERARRAVFVVSAGSVGVSVGELEDALLATAAARPHSEAEALEERRTLALELLHAKLLEEEAEHQGLEAQPAVRITVRNALVDALMERDFATSGFGEWATGGTMLPTRRRGIVVLGRDRASLTRLPNSIADLNEWDVIAARSMRPVGGGVSPGETEWLSAEPRPQESPFPRALRDQLFQLEDDGHRSSPVEVDGNWAAIVLSGRREPEPEVVPGELTPWERREGAIGELLEHLKAQYLTDVNVEPLYRMNLAIESPPASEASDTDGFQTIPLDENEAVQHPSGAGEGGAGE